MARASSGMFRTAAASGSPLAFAAATASFTSVCARDRPSAGVASRTYAPEVAREMLKLLYVHPPAQPQQQQLPQDGKRSDKSRKAIELFDAGLEIYPSSKLRHMEAPS